MCAHQLNALYSVSPLAPSSCKPGRTSFMYVQIWTGGILSESLLGAANTDGLSSPHFSVVNRKLCRSLAREWFRMQSPNWMYHRNALSNATCQRTGLSNGSLFIAPPLFIAPRGNRTSNSVLQRRTPRYSVVGRRFRDDERSFSMTAYSVLNTSPSME